MKAIGALWLLKKHGLVHKSMTLRDLKLYRDIFHPQGNWKDVVKGIMMTEYLVGKRDLSEPIVVHEVKFAIGGTLNIHTGRLE